MAGLFFHKISCYLNYVASQKYFASENASKSSFPSEEDIFLSHHDSSVSPLSWVEEEMPVSRKIETERASQVTPSGKKKGELNGITFPEY
jgi:hypothetical protein